MIWNKIRKSKWWGKDTTVLMSMVSIIAFILTMLYFLLPSDYAPKTDMDFNDFLTVDAVLLGSIIAFVSLAAAIPKYWSDRNVPSESCISLISWTVVKPIQAIMISIMTMFLEVILTFGFKPISNKEGIKIMFYLMLFLTSIKTMLMISQIMRHYLFSKNQNFDDNADKKDVPDKKTFSCTKKSQKRKENKVDKNSKKEASKKNVPKQ